MTAFRFQQIEKFLPAIPQNQVFVIDKSSDPLPSAGGTNTIVIVSYNQMVIRNQVLIQHGYKAIIFVSVFLSYMCSVSAMQFRISDFRMNLIRSKIPSPNGPKLR